MSKHVDTFPVDGSTILKHVWISYNQFIRELYHKIDFTAAEPVQINRHWLLHGRSDFEIKELECIRLFNSIWKSNMHRVFTKWRIIKSGWTNHSY